jgi:hypothetical protein
MSVARIDGPQEGSPMLRLSVTVTASCLLLTGCALLDVQGKAQPPYAVSRPAPDAGQIDGGLRDALAQGVATAVATLGRPNGFWGNAAVRIPLPSQLARAEPTLRRLGMGARVDEFQRALNQAAEEATPYAAEVFGHALRQMTLADAQSILRGSEDAATQYFRRSAGPALASQLRPYVVATTQRVGVTQRYKSLVGDHATLLQRAGMEPLDLDDYVTGRTLDGLFFMLAAEEARIRRDPRARGTELMRQVFGML